MLRHGAEESGIALTDDGYADWADISKLKAFEGVSLETIETVVQTSDKQRFKMVTDSTTGTVMIRANQGHTVTTVNPEKLLTKLSSADLSDYPYVVHGTTVDAWPVENPNKPPLATKILLEDTDGLRRPPLEGP